MKNIVEQAIESSEVVAAEQRNDKIKEAWELAEKEKSLLDYNRQSENDALRWEKFEAVGGTSCAKKAQDEAEEWRRSRDAWIIRVVGPFKARRKKKQKKAEIEADPERQMMRQLEL